MMAHTNGVLLWLRWTAVLMVKNAEGQSSMRGNGAEMINSNQAGGRRSGDRENDGVRGFGRNNRSGFRKGGFRGKGRRSGHQSGDQASADNLEDEKEDAKDVAVVQTTAVITVEQPGSSPGSTINLVAPIATLTESAPQQPASVAGSALTESTPALLADIKSPNSANNERSSLQSVPEPTISSTSTRSSAASHRKATTSTTPSITTSDTPLPNTTSNSESKSEEDAATPTVTAPAPSLDTATSPASSTKSLNGDEKAGIGIGVTIAVLAIAGLIAFILYRRRNPKNRQRLGSVDGTRGPETATRPSLFPTTSSDSNDLNRSETKTDRGWPEWIIESASKVRVVGRVESVKSADVTARSSMASSAQNLASGSEPTNEKALEVRLVDMKIPNHKLSLDLVGMALGGNPPMSPSGSAPTSPKEQHNTENWPLPN